jgi:UDP-N-acetylglucosamine--N-acetylmuramyl-(pentapeptide) pyrophosphoryl-undecaprenol N-acetylglucosamine transferase
MKSQEQLKFIITTGGSGGHMFPAVSLALELYKLNSNVHFVTDQRGDRYKEKLDNAVKVHHVIARKLGEYGFFGKLISLFLLSLGFVQSLFLILKIRPNVVIGMGSYASFPILMAAKVLGKPYVLADQNTVLGRSNEFFVKGAKFVATAYKNVKGVPKNIPQKLVGNPLRQEFEELYKRHEYKAPGMFEDFNILVTGGSQGARVLDVMAPNAIGLIGEKKDRVKVYHQGRMENAEAIKYAYEREGIECEVSNFFDFTKLMPEIHLVIARAGAGTCSAIKAVGLPAVFIPLKTRSNKNHQYFNALELVEKNAARVIIEEELSEEKLANIIKELISDKKKLKLMADNAKELAITNSSSKLAGAVLELAALDFK